MLGKLLLTFAIVAVLFALLIVVVTYLGMIWFFITFVVLIAIGIWLYHYNEKKTRCPLQK